MSTARKILIVDDDADLRETLTDQLALHEEFVTVAAENASDGLAAAKSDHVDLILLDVGLPTWMAVRPASCFAKMATRAR